jgi:hypothetical protein
LATTFQITLEIGIAYHLVFRREIFSRMCTDAAAKRRSDDILMYCFLSDPHRYCINLVSVAGKPTTAKSPDL